MSDDRWSVGARHPILLCPNAQEPFPVTTPDLRAQLQVALGASYILERELGRGGMATVFLAQDAKHGRRIALKVLHPDLAASLGPERFRREIGFAATLQHPHILTVLDSGETATGELWFTMPYVEGESLRARLTRQRQLAVDDALRITREVALALEYAHRHGVVHRDVKPENILLTADGQALVADFGIARALTPGTAGGTLTETGMAIGTPQYMSPEQAAGERTLDGTSDVYSLGAVLYEMLAGEPPFTGPTAQAIVAKMMAGEPPSVRRVRPSVPEPIDTAIRKALAPVPADRFPTAIEFSRTLEVAQRSGETAAAVAAPPSPPPPAPASPRRKRIPVGASLLGLGFLIGVGVLFAWRHRAGTTAGTGDAGTLAVLPFENLGDSTDAYFADGITDEVRGKLATLHGLRVIASGSSSQYKHTTKSQEEIARELGAQYLLVGRVRWEKLPGGKSRVRVDPELVQVTNGNAPATTWQQDFDADLTDVFQVQADIAEKVAQQLRLRLGSDDRQALAERPTQNLDAYDAYLRGIEIGKQGNDFSVLRKQLAAFDEAVTRDSTFALAWVELARAHAQIYFSGVPTAAEADSVRHAAERAVALAPDLPEAHGAMGSYYQLVRSDFARALAEDSIGLAHAPNNAGLLSQTARVDESLGRWDAAADLLQRAQRLDPQSASVAGSLGLTELWLRDYTAARTAYDRALVFQPTNLAIVEGRAMVELAQGNLPAARAILHAMPATVDSGTVAEFMGDFWDVGWLLDSAYERVLFTLTPSAFDNRRSAWGIVFAQQYGYRGDWTRARAYGDSARAGYEAELKITPQDPQGHAFRGLALAYMGRAADAIQEGQHAAALEPIAQDARDGPYWDHVLARIYVLAGQPEKAIDELEIILKTPYFVSPAWLRVDPNFARLKGNPRFERLIAAGS
jgi:serine/threonine protein kinase/TolB-like protein